MCVCLDGVGMVTVGGRSRVAGAWLRCVCVRVRVSLCLFVCVVPCHVVCRTSLLVYFFACRSSLVVNCRLSFVLLCSVVLCCFGCVVWWCVWLCVLGKGRGRVCASNTPPVWKVQNALRVYQHHAHMFYTCGLGAGTHGDVLNFHTGVVQRVMAHTTPHHTSTHTTHNDTLPTNLRLNVPQHGKTYQV